MPGNIGTPAPWCPVCGLYFNVKGCTPERCNNPERPDVDPTRPCNCDACVRDGQHEVGCVVHEEPARACDCARGRR